MSFNINSVAWASLHCCVCHTPTKRRLLCRGEWGERIKPISRNQWDTDCKKKKEMWAIDSWLFRYFGRSRLELSDAMAALLLGWCGGSFKTNKSIVPSEEIKRSNEISYFIFFSRSEVLFFCYSCTHDLRALLLRCCRWFGLCSSPATPK